MAARCAARAIRDLGCFYGLLEVTCHACRLGRRRGPLSPGPAPAQGRADPRGRPWTCGRCPARGLVGASRHCDRRRSCAWSRCQTPPRTALVSSPEVACYWGGKQERSDLATVVFGQMRNRATMRDDRLRTLDGLRWRNLGLIGRGGRSFASRAEALTPPTPSRVPDVDGPFVGKCRRRRAGAALGRYSRADRADRFMRGRGTERSSRLRRDVD
jgi:hypothetical protein